MLPVASAGSKMGFWNSAETAGSAVKLDYKVLGRTGLKVTTVGFGCMITSDGSVIERAADAGINYFDTARGYSHGNNERMVGAALGAKRKQVVLSTKTHAPDKAGMQQHLEQSLRELNTDYIDIWYLHGRSSGTKSATT
jgi:aryl-alcohol dehydrogenase-like predicted oxidoreductase